MTINGRILYMMALISFGALFGCKQVYLPKTTATNANVLVVEGSISTNDSTIIRLSRTVIVASKTATNPETKATITIENAQATLYTLTETVKGTYISPALTLDNTKQYRLRIKTSNGKTYVSDLVDAQVTPPIDSIGFNITPGSAGMQVYVNSHNTLDAARYYKYSYRETWQFHAFYAAGYIATGPNTIVQREAAQDVFLCFQTDTSANITLASTASLSQNQVYQSPIALVPSTSEKVELEYSILVAQQALSPLAYSFWFNLRKNTEQLGSIFDSLPFQAIGNIHNANDATEPVVGYVSAGTVQKKRVFIYRRQLPNSWMPLLFEDCSLDSLFKNNPHTKMNDLSHLVPGGYYTDQFSEFGGGWLSTSAACANCTLRGNKNPPSYWKY